MDQTERKDLNQVEDAQYESRDDAFMDIDRMVNEGLGGGTVSPQNGYIGATTTDTMDGSQEEME